MLVMLVVGIPLYVCATGSIPIAASLILKGMSPGAGLVFLIAGPATNTVTISTVWKTLGKRTLALYLGSIVVISLLLGYLLDLLFGNRVLVQASLVHGVGLPLWFNYATGALLLGVILNAILRRERGEERELEDEDIVVLRIPGLTCKGCASAIRGALRPVRGVNDVAINLKLRTVTIAGKFDVEAAKAALRDAGYETEEN